MLERRLEEKIREKSRCLQMRVQTRGPCVSTFHLLVRLGRGSVYLIIVLHRVQQHRTFLVRGRCWRSHWSLRWELGRSSEYLIIVLSCQMERALVKNSMAGLRMGKMGKLRRGLEEKRDHLRLPSSPKVGGRWEKNLVPVVSEKKDCELCLALLTRSHICEYLHSLYNVQYFS